MSESNSIDLAAWCNEQNARAMNKGMEFWYVVIRRRDANGQMVPDVDRLDGWRAREAQDRWRGKVKPPFKPTPAEAAAIHKRIGELIREGITQAEFNEMVERGWIMQGISGAPSRVQRQDGPERETPF